jgi:hypothetical protein
MTPDERDLLTRFLQDLTGARTGPKDPEADRMIAQALSANPDAAYLLVQHTILSDQALHAAQARIAELERQASAQPAPSFLGGGQPWAGQQARPQTAVPQTAAPLEDYPPQQPPPWAGAPGPFSSGGGLGSFLRSAGTTAAGVVGGEMLFEGLSGLFGGHRGLFGGGGFGGGGFGGGFGGGYPQVENVTVNNYDDDDRDRGDRDDGSWNDDDNGGGFDDGNY